MGFDVSLINRANLSPLAMPKDKNNGGNAALYSAPYSMQPKQQQVVPGGSEALTATKVGAQPTGIMGAPQGNGLIKDRGLVARLDAMDASSLNRPNGVNDFNGQRLYTLA